MAVLTPEEREKVSKYFKYGLIAVVSVVALCLVAVAFGSNDSGYSLVYRNIWGGMGTILEPRPYFRLGADEYPFPKTVNFHYAVYTDGEGKRILQGNVKEGPTTYVGGAFPGRFNDSFTSQICLSGRILFPRSGPQLIALINDHSLYNWRTIEQDVVRGHLTGVLRRATALLSARESYDEKKGEFELWVSDMAKNGKYETRAEPRRVYDATVGDTIYKDVQVILRDDKDEPLYEENPLAQYGLSLDAVVVKKVVYSPRSEKQIKDQQDAHAKIATDRILEEQAEQEKRLAIANGKRKQEEMRIDMEMDRLKQTLTASKQSETDSIDARAIAIKDSVAAHGKLIAARLNTLEAAEYKKATLARAEADAGAKKLLANADGSLEMRLQYLVQGIQANATAVENRDVPSIYMAGGGGQGGAGAGMSDAAVASYLQLQTAQLAKQFGVSLDVPAIKK